jgi:murein L,D-transpeptidase YafK
VSRSRTAAAVLLLAGALVPLAAVAQQASDSERDGRGPRLLGERRVLGDATQPVTLLRPDGLERHAQPEFLARQLAAPNVFDTRVEVRFALRALFRARGLEYPPRDLFLRVFKQEQLVEVWVRPDLESRYVLLRTYPMCTLPGRLGPKRRQGDFQLPEGFYFINIFNPASRYRLSLGIDYPNASDRLRAGPEPLGGDIFIHGGCATEGCVPLDDHDMRELYLLAVETRAAGQLRIPIHIFPTRMSAEGMRWLQERFAPDPELATFWDDLRAGFAHFEETGEIPVIAVLERGRYQVWAEEAPAALSGSVGAETRGPVRKGDGAAYAPAEMPVGSPVQAAPGSRPGGHMDPIGRGIPGPRL